MTELQQIALRRALLCLLACGSLVWLGSNPQQLWQVLQGWCIEVQADGSEKMVYGAACDLRQIRVRQAAD